MTAPKNDPLFIIFEKHFFEAQMICENDFFKLVVDDYLNYLKYSGAIIPLGKEKIIIDEVQLEVKDILKAYLKNHKSIKRFLESEDYFYEAKEKAIEKYFKLF